MSYLDSPRGVSGFETECLVVFGAVDDSLSSCMSVQIFYNANLKWWWVCKSDIMEKNMYIGFY